MALGPRSVLTTDFRLTDVEYADDTVLLSRTRFSLHRFLHTLLLYEGNVLEPREVSITHYKHRASNFPNGPIPVRAISATPARIRSSRRNFA